MFSYHSNNPDYASKSYDRWGNYKNVDNNPGAKGDNQVIQTFPILSRVIALLLLSMLGHGISQK